MDAEPDKAQDGGTPQAGGRLTMADLARLAGVSKITVSRALADSPLVRPELRARVQELARQHGYRLNLSARSLRLQQRNVIAVVLEMDPSPDRPMSDPYPLELLGGICQELTTAGYNVLLTPRQGIESPAVQGADGIILLGQGSHNDAARQLGHAHVPLVVWGAKRPGRSHVVVGSDNRRGGASAAERLLSLGRRRAVFLGDTSHPEIDQRCKGFEAALKAGGGALVAKLPSVFTFAAGSTAVNGLLDRGEAFDGLFAASDLLAMGAVRALLDRGLAVPDAVSVIGYDDIPLAACFTPPLTTIHQDWHAGGVLLARKVRALVEGEETDSAVLPTRLVVRGT